MSKDAVFTMKLEPALRDAFMDAAQATHQSASQVLRDLMREFVQRQVQARDYDAYLLQKVDAARASIGAGLGQSDAEVEALFAARRATASTP